MSCCSFDWWHKGSLTGGEEGDASVTVIEDLLGHSTFDLNGLEELLSERKTMLWISHRL